MNGMISGNVLGRRCCSRNAAQRSLSVMKVDCDAAATLGASWSVVKRPDRIRRHNSRENRPLLLSGNLIRVTAAPELSDSLIMDMLSQVTAMCPAEFIRVSNSAAGRTLGIILAASGCFCSCCRKSTGVLLEAAIVHEIAVAVSN